jgi:lysozyme
MPVASDALEKRFEGCVLYAYDDLDPHYPHPPFMPGEGPVGTLTIGYGHTGDDVHPGQVITPEEAEALLQADIRCFEVAVNNMVAHDITPNQFAALVDFAFNEGAEALRSSTLLAMLNAGNIEGAASQFTRWDEAGGQVLQGLLARREAEKELFLKP